MGVDVPIANGTNSDAYQRGVEGRIDDPNAGWNGRGLWATNDSRASWHTEGGSRSRGAQMVHFQMRPNPLAK